MINENKICLCKLEGMNLYKVNFTILIASIMVSISCSNAQNNATPKSGIDNALNLLKQGVIDSTLITYGDSPEFKWFYPDTTNKLLCEMLESIKFRYPNGYSKSLPIKDDFAKDCSYEYAITDLNHDNILGIAQRTGGMGCSGNAIMDVGAVYENGGMLTSGEISQFYADPSYNEIILNYKKIPLKPNKYSIYKMESEIPKIFFVDFPRTHINQPKPLPVNPLDDFTFTDQENVRNIRLDFMQVNAMGRDWRDSIFKQPVLKQRLFYLVGKEHFKTMRDRLFAGPCMPIMREGYYYCWGMQPHSGGAPGALILIDFNKNVIYVGIKDKKQFYYFSEDNFAMPPLMVEYKNAKTY
jgi:hypothetical protein